jgi:hypothetical protein
LTFSISDPVTVEVPLGFFGPRFHLCTFNLGRTELGPPFGRALLVVPSRNPLPNSPEVDDFRHVNVRRYPDACEVDRD